MNRNELIARLQAESHRDDLDFTAAINDATEILNRRFGLELVNLIAGTDSNDILTNRPLLYIYAGMQACGRQQEDAEAVAFYGALMQAAYDGVEITDAGSIGKAETGQMTGRKWG